MTAKTTEVATTKPAPSFLAATNTSPDFLKAGGRGNENVGNNLEIPRIKLLQKMNDEVDKHHSNYIEGAQPGQFLNVLSKELHDEIYVISVNFRVEYVIWRKREAGGGKQGTFDSRQEALNWISEQPEKDQATFDLSENHQHLLLCYDEVTGSLRNTPCIMDFSGSKLRVSKNWNSKILERGGDRFSTIWKFKPQIQSNDKGSWVNIAADYMGFVANENDYKQAEELYLSTNNTH